MKRPGARNSPSDGEFLDTLRLDDSSVIAAFAVSAEGRVLAANPRFARLIGVESGRELVGRRIVDLVVDRKDWDAWRRDCLSGRGRGTTLRFRGRDQNPVLLRGDICPAGSADGSNPEPDAHLVGVFVDVTEEEKLKQAVQRGARFEALGSLTSGIAHDFNNLLTVLVGNLYLAAEDLRDQPKSFAKLKAARDAAKRGADLIRQLLAFARREAVDADVVDPAKIVDGLLPLLRRALGSRIKLDARLEPDAGMTRCNGAQLESVIVNLAVNSRDAIESSGSIVVSVASAHLSAAAAAQRELGAGDYVRIAVTDDGAGIPRETLTRVFEPFFSTKGDRGGTGLGLSMVRWFAEQAGGTVYIDSEPRKGTKVCLLLPRSVDSAAETSAKTMPLSKLPSGTENVLVFARDEGLRTTIKQILEVLGYRVQLCEDARATLDAVRSEEIDLLLVDSAAQPAPERQYLLREACAANSSLKVILAVDAGHAGQARAPKGIALLEKPFSLADLAGTLRQALRDPPCG